MRNYFDFSLLLIAAFVLSGIVAISKPDFVYVMLIVAAVYLLVKKLEYSRRFLIYEQIEFSATVARRKRQKEIVKKELHRLGVGNRIIIPWSYTGRKILVYIDKEEKHPKDFLRCEIKKFMQYQ